MEKNSTIRKKSYNQAGMGVGGKSKDIGTINKILGIYYNINIFAHLHRSIIERVIPVKVF